MQPDIVTTVGHRGKTHIQHGPLNDRVYLMKLDTVDLPDIADHMEELGRNEGYSKLFARVPAFAAEAFTERGFIREARAHGLYRGERSGMFMGKYLDAARAEPEDRKAISNVLAIAGDKTAIDPDEVDTAAVVALGTGHAQALAQLYSSVFESYPFPVHDPDFLIRAMQSNVRFFGIFRKDQLVAASSAELDADWRCAEMTDFATLPEYRNRKAALRLLTAMEAAIAEQGYLSAYTIARAASTAMNCVFARAGYTFGGTLINNTNISGGLESMNVWSKPLAA